MNTINYLFHDAIDKRKWDQRIDEASNGLIYAKSSYLDHMSPSWHALAMGDYDFVMPLTWRKKWGFSYLYQPAFAPQLGIFGEHLTTEIIEAFLASVQQHFRFAEIFFHHHNRSGNLTSQHCNLVLSLDAPFSILQQNFKKTLGKSITRTNRFRLSYVPSEDYKNAIRLYRETHGSAMPHVGEREYDAFEKICEAARANGQLVVREVHTQAGEPLSVNLLLRDQRRMYNLMSTTTPNGRTLEANHVLLLELIKEFAGQPIVLDLEGSDIQGIARFYRKFGAVDEPYYFLRFNRLPFFVRWFKKG